VNEPAVSIVVPCYNSGQFLDGLMDSLAAQTFRNFEIVIVNDGSTEQVTLDKLNSLRATVRVIDQENRFLPGARNTGFREARAPLVLPLDCDDRIDPTYLAETVAAMGRAAPNVGFAYTYMRLTGAVEGIFKTRFDCFDQLFINRLPYCMLFRKTAWAAVNGYDETMRQGSEDWEFSIRLVQTGFRGVEIAKPLLAYAVRPEGMLLSKTAHLQGTMWLCIRSKHAALYRLPTLLKQWRDTNRSWYSALRAITILTLAKILPERSYNALYFRTMSLARGWRIRRGHLRTMANLV
jgi:glycosyltransferase involved in cell wall biosynthesis